MIELFSSCPRSDKVARSRFLDVVSDAAAWSDRAGCSGIVVPADEDVVDPWMVAHTIVRHSSALCPVIAVRTEDATARQLARQISSFAFLHGRRAGVSLIGGGADAADFAGSVQRMLECRPEKLAPPLPSGLRPLVLLPGTAVTVGVIARESSDHAWALARSRFPCARRRTEESGPQWLVPMREYDAGCPYLVGSYDAVAAELERHLAAGRRRFIVNVPVDPEDLDHVKAAFGRTPTSISHYRASARCDGADPVAGAPAGRRAGEWGSGLQKAIEAAS
jgi:alkanesulfonate monooxygenase